MAVPHAAPCSGAPAERQRGAALQPQALPHRARRTAGPGHGQMPVAGRSLAPGDTPPRAGSFCHLVDATLFCRLFKQGPPRRPASSVRPPSRGHSRAHRGCDDTAVPNVISFFPGTGMSWGDLQPQVPGRLLKPLSCTLACRATWLNRLGHGPRARGLRERR